MGMETNSEMDDYELNDNDEENNNTAESGELVSEQKAKLVRTIRAHVSALMVLDSPIFES